MLLSSYIERMQHFDSENTLGSRDYLGGLPMSKFIKLIVC